MYTMPFGRYRGRPLSALPDGYLAWLDALDGLRPRLRAAVDAEVARRRDPFGSDKDPCDVSEAAADAPAHANPPHPRPLPASCVVIDFAAARARLRPAATAVSEARSITTASPSDPERSHNPCRSK
jgi:hypothetical protein